MKLTAFGQDVEKAENGVWVDLGEGCRVKVARSGSARSERMLKKLTAPHQRAIQMGSIPDALLERLNAEHTSKAILLDWEGLQDADGTEIPFSQAKAFEILSNPEYRDFKDQVLYLAREAETFRKQQIDETVGKSQAS